MRLKDDDISKWLRGRAMRDEIEMRVKVPAWRQQVPRVGVMLAATALGAAIWLHAAGPGAHAGTDFGAYLAGARAVATGQNPYHALISQPTDATAGDSGLHAHGYVYPPLLALLLAIPLRLGLDARGIWLLWAALNVAAVVWMGWEMQRYLLASSHSRLRQWTGALAFASACLLPAVVTYDLWLGQADLLMAALAVGACGLWARGNRWAALVLAVAIAVKPTLALLLVVWLWKGDWRAALRGAVASVTLIALSFIPVGLAALHDYLIFFSQWNAFHANAEYINQSPYGMLLRIFTRNPYTQPLVNAPWLVLPLRLMALGGALWLWARAVPGGISFAKGKIVIKDEGNHKGLPLHTDHADHRRGAIHRAQPRPARSSCHWFRRGEGMPRPPSVAALRPERDPSQIFAGQLLALPLIVLLSPLAEDIHFCLIVPTLVGLGYLAWRRGLARTVAAWALWIAFALSCIPRMQEMIYPDRFVPLPGQSDPHLGPLITLLRTGALLYLAIVALVAGGAVLRVTAVEETVTLLRKAS